MRDYARAYAEALSKQAEPVAYGDRLGTHLACVYPIPENGAPPWMQKMTPLYTEPPALQTEPTDCQAKPGEWSACQLRTIKAYEAINPPAQVRQAEPDSPAAGNAGSRTLMDAWDAGANEGGMPQKGVCISPLATRPVLYTDTINGGQQAMRDDLWAVTTAELNALHIAATAESQTPPAQAQKPTPAPAEQAIVNATKTNFALAGQVNDLAMLTRRLVHALNHASPDNAIAKKAADYLVRNGLQGSPLRVEDALRDDDATQPAQQPIGMDAQAPGELDKVDAERYRQLRELAQVRIGLGGEWQFAVYVPAEKFKHKQFSKEQFDDAIDAARAKEKANG
jgi:hypothetical protein